VLLSRVKAFRSSCISKLCKDSFIRRFPPQRGRLGLVSYSSVLPQLQSPAKQASGGVGVGVGVDDVSEHALVVIATQSQCESAGYYWSVKSGVQTATEERLQNSWVGTKLKGLTIPNQLACGNCKPKVEAVSPLNQKW
jgi:hypothetical protein